MRSALLRAQAPALALGIAMLIGNLLILLHGQSPLEIWGAMLSGTWGSAYGIGQVLFKATPLALCGISVALAFRAGLFNVGAEGQMQLGALAAAVLGAALPGWLPSVFAVLACVLAAVLAGGGLGALAGVLRARFGAHEVITTIMLNFIVAAFCGWVLTAGLAMPETMHTAPVIAAAQIPRLGEMIPALHGSAASWALLIVPLAAVAFAWTMRRTRAGMEIRAVGLAPDAAAATGTDVGRVRILAMTLAGAIAALPAISNVLGYRHVYEQGFGAGAGFMGIAVALLGQGSAGGIVAASLVFATLSQGGLVINARVPKDMVEVLEAAVILVVVAATAARGLATKHAAAQETAA